MHIFLYVDTNFVTVAISNHTLNTGVTYPFCIYLLYVFHIKDSKFLFKLQLRPIPQKYFSSRNIAKLSDYFKHISMILELIYNRTVFFFPFPVNGLYKRLSSQDSSFCFSVPALSCPNIWYKTENLTTFFVSFFVFTEKQKEIDYIIFY